MTEREMAVLKAILAFEFHYITWLSFKLFFNRMFYSVVVLGDVIILMHDK